MDGGYLGFGKMTSVGAREKSRLENLFAQKFSIDSDLWLRGSGSFLAPRGIVWWIDAISKGVLKFCGVST